MKVDSLKLALVAFTYSIIISVFTFPSFDSFSQDTSNPIIAASPKEFFPFCTDSERDKLRALFNKDDNLPIIIDGFDLLMVLEETKNVPLFRQDTNLVSAKMGAYPIEKVTIQCTKGFCKSIKDKFIRNINGEKKVFFPMHPLNTDPNVPGYEVINGSSQGGRNVDIINLRNLASRSKVAIESNMPPVGLKIGTNYVLPNVYQPSKADTYTETYLTVARTKHMDHTDKLIGVDPNLIFLREIASSRLNDKKRGGFAIREMDPLRSGDIYIPAFSIPYVGPQIAAANGEEFSKFWGRVYAYNLGKSKAKLLLRYGLQMQTPNSQNILIKLDKQLRPLDTIVFRDNGDTQFVKPIINALEPKSRWFQYDESLVRKLGISRDEFIKDYIFAHNSNSTWRFDEAPGKQAVSYDIIVDWNKKQAEGYLDEINSELGVNIRPLNNPTDPQISNYKKMISDPLHENNFGKDDELRFIVPVYKYLTSTEGKLKLSQYRKRKIKLEKERRNGVEVNHLESCLNPASVINNFKRSAHLNETNNQKRKYSKGSNSYGPNLEESSGQRYINSGAI